MVALNQQLYSQLIFFSVFFFFHFSNPLCLFPYFQACPVAILTSCHYVFAALRLHQLLPVGRELLVCVQGDSMAWAETGTGPGPNPRERCRARSCGEAVSRSTWFLLTRMAPLQPPLASRTALSLLQVPPPVFWTLSFGGKNLGNPLLVSCWDCRSSELLWLDSGVLLRVIPRSSLQPEHQPL